LSEKDLEQVLVSGMVEGYKFQSKCSKEYFIKISASLFETLLEAMDLLKTEYLDVFCIGTIIGQSKDEEKSLILKLFYIGGSIGDINLIHIEKKSK
jgi:hypothetical protein